MSENKKDNLDETLDWEYMSDFYDESGKERAVRSFDEIVSEYEDAMKTPEADIKSYDNAKLEEMAKLVGQIRVMISEGKMVVDIAKELSLDEKYVTDIVVTIMGSADDHSDIAIAHLMLV